MKDIKKIVVTIITSLICSFVIFFGNLVIKVYALEEKVQSQRDLMVEIRDDVKMIKEKLIK